MAGILKKTTGLTGLAVHPAPQHTLRILYSKILRALQKMPESAAYRKYTEAIITERSVIIKNSASIAELEHKIGCGQAEELIVQAENELLLARKMLTWKPWEPLVTEALEEQWSWPPAQLSNK